MRLFSRLLTSGLPLLVALALLSAGCGDDETAIHGPTGESDADTDAETDAILPVRCEAPPGLGSPQTIAEALELMNALPAPVTVPCFVQSLDRPLALTATTSTVSAQPAGSANNPRIFIFSGPLVLSIVPGGIGRDVLEFGEPRGDFESLKGELIMPVDQPIPAGKPFEHLRFSSQTTICGFCHRDEHLAVDQDHPNAFISRVLRPVDELLVGVDDLRAKHVECDAEFDPMRCEILSAVFDHGPVIEQSFPEELKTIFDP